VQGVQAVSTLSLKPTHKAVKAYYESISGLAQLSILHEGAVSPAFAALLRVCARQYNWTLAEQYSIKRGESTIRADGALLDSFKLIHGIWEAKDTEDDLDVEVKRKFDAGYPKDNTLFQAPDRIIIWQDGHLKFDDSIVKPEFLVEGLKAFFQYEPPAYEQWQQAVEEFKLRVRELGDALLGLIERERHANLPFIKAFEQFGALCQQTINPNLSTAAIEDMLIQHILTERLFRKVFDNPDFVERNAIAQEIEKVVQALTSRSFSRKEFLQPLDRFYGAIESTASTLTEFSEKQGFLNAVYERFFQGFSVKVADTHGIVYTPPPIVHFMVRSVEDILQKEFGRSLADKDVHLLDPFVGTGTFVVFAMREMPKIRLPDKYATELHCNEVMLLPYYIASMNIEHAYYELVGDYKPFNGICLVDTFELAEPKGQQGLFLQQNTERVDIQKRTPIFVIIGNPPYNAGQLSENDNNKNRKYPVIDKHISETYGKDSAATLLRKLSDPYVKAIRWATDRIGEEGIVAFVTNNSFVTEVTFDGMRKHLQQDFDTIYILDLGGNVRKNPKLSGTTHNVFGIQVGVSINLLVRKKNGPQPRSASIYYARVGEDWRKEDKYSFLERSGSNAGLKWTKLEPDAKHNWLTEGMSREFDKFIPIGTKESKSSKDAEERALFKLFSVGVNTARDRVVYDFDRAALERRVEQFSDDYNAETSRYADKGRPKNVDDFVSYEKVQWSSTLKNNLRAGTRAVFDRVKIRDSLYRPFTTEFLYYDRVLNERTGHFKVIFPTPKTQSENRVICVPAAGGRSQYWCFMAGLIPSFTLTSIDGTQCFPCYTYAEDGSSHHENITDWALKQFRTHYRDEGISKWDIFHYVYAILHHPKYREKYAANLKRELPRTPYAPDFSAFAKAGARLAELHVDYESQPEFPLVRLENKDARLNWQVEKMRLSKDKTQLVCNDFLTLGGIPPEAFDYRLGNRSALEWVIDQYRVTTDKRSGIVSDPNRPDDPQYIVRLVGKVITVSLETMKVVNGLPVIE
jgi:predicted helicase